MNDPRDEDVTRLLREAAAGGGGKEVVDRLWSRIYGELRALAGRYLDRERPDHTLQPTALVHEAYLRLVDSSAARWNDRAHFFRVAARAMRRILVDHARRHRAARRGGGGAGTAPLDPEAIGVEPDLDLVALDEALERLARRDEGKARVVELRFFAGLTCEETGKVLGVSTRTVERDWSFARAWLFRLMGGTA